MSRSDPVLAPHPRPTSSAPFSAPPRQAPAIPAYLAETYRWAYLSAFGTRFFDHQVVVNSILWGNARRLIRWACEPLRPGQSVMQPAAVYGSFSRDVAATIGPHGHLTLTDVAPIQVALTTRKVADLPHVQVSQCDATVGNRGPYDAITCFFLLHEVPNEIKTGVVDALLSSVKPGGQVIFVDYHRPAAWHPLRPIMAGVFRWLEPFANDLLAHEIQDYASTPQVASWSKDTKFGGLYQRVIAQRLR